MNEETCFTFIKESTKAFPSDRALPLPTVESSPTLLFTSGMRMTRPESQTLPQQARRWPDGTAPPWLLQLLSSSLEDASFSSRGCRKPQSQGSMLHWNISPRRRFSNQTETFFGGRESNKEKV